MSQKEYFIKSNNKAAYAVKTAGGYELWSNDRKLHIIIEKTTAFNPFNNSQQEVYVTKCWMFYVSSWVRGDNSTTVTSIDEYIKELAFSPTLQMLLMSTGNKTIYQNKICKIQ